MVHPNLGNFHPLPKEIFSSFFSNLQISEKTIGQKNKEKNLGRAQIWPYLLEFEEFRNSKSISASKFSLKQVMTLLSGSLKNQELRMGYCF